MTSGRQSCRCTTLFVLNCISLRTLPEVQTETDSKRPPTRARVFRTTLWLRRDPEVRESALFTDDATTKSKLSKFCKTCISNIHPPPLFTDCGWDQVPRKTPLPSAPGRSELTSIFPILAISARASELQEKAQSPRGPHLHGNAGPGKICSWTVPTNEWMLQK